MSPTPEAPLHSMNPLGRFSDRADDYAKYRPSYPSPAIDAVLNGLGNPAALLAADIGAGTGISSRLLADRTVRVIAIEPNAAMRDAAEPHPLVRFAEGSAEKTGLDAASVDLVLCAQAFHWFRPAESLAEFARILRSRGRVAIVWNIRDERDPFSMEYTELIRQATECDLAVDRIQVPTDLRDSPLFTGYREQLFRHSQALDAQGLLGRALSASYVPRSGPAHDRLVAGLRGLHARRADARGQVSLVYTTQVFLAEKR